MKSTKIEYYDWFDLQSKICEEMNIEQKYFRDYHNIIGGEYKDLWHEWLRYFEGNVINGHIIDCELGECIESKLEWINEDGKSWLEPFIKAVYKVFDDNDVKYIRYFW